MLTKHFLLFEMLSATNMVKEVYLGKPELYSSSILSIISSNTVFIMSWFNSILLGVTQKAAIIKTQTFQDQVSGKKICVPVVWIDVQWWHTYLCKGIHMESMRSVMQSIYICKMWNSWSQSESMPNPWNNTLPIFVLTIHNHRTHAV